jgi:hypothetical protein
MTDDKLGTQNHGGAASEAELWLQLSDCVRDAGDRTFRLVLFVASSVAILLAAGWAWAMPSFS